MHTNPPSESETDELAAYGDRSVVRRDLTESTSPSVAVVEAVATATGGDSGDLPLLYEVINPDALDALFAPRHDGTPRIAGKVRFSLAGCEVTVTGDGEVLVRGPAASAGQDSGTASQTG